MLDKYKNVGKYKNVIDLWSYWLVLYFVEILSVPKKNYSFRVLESMNLRMSRTAKFGC
jgi:hypothetical protein